jgi:hypothetical protein
MIRKIQINGIIPGYSQGSVVTVQCDDEGTPLEFFWRRQLKNARLDKCCEFVEETQDVEDDSTDEEEE